jgi:phosphatidate phosphatase PAH1
MPAFVAQSMRSLGLAIALLGLTLPGCAQSSGGGGSGGAAGSGATSGTGGAATGTPAPAATLLRWDEYDHEFVLPARESWRSFLTPFIVAGHTPHHRGYDLVLGQGQTAPVRGKFHYGDLYKDLEGERVGCWIRQAGGSGWTHVGDAVTNGDGRAQFAFPSAVVPSAGTYFVKWVVYGDLTTANALIRVLDRSTPAVLFDIDGTLTIDDEQMVLGLLGQLTDRTYVPIMYDDADWVAQQLALQGFEITYVTARPYFLGDASREWLVLKGLPLGTIFTAEGTTDTFRSDDARDYKHAKLNELQAAGVAFDYAFGNAESDIAAYALAGIPTTRTYILGPHAGQGGTIALGAYRDLFGVLVPIR